MLEIRLEEEIRSRWPGWYRPRPEDLQLAISLVLHARRAGEGGRGLAAVVLTGPPGAGKTSFARALAQTLGAGLQVFLAHHWVSEEDLMGRIDPSRVAALAGGILRENPGAAYVPGVLPVAALHSWDAPLVLLLDEWDKAPERVDALLLDFLQGGRALLPGEFREAILRAAEEIGLPDSVRAEAVTTGPALAVRAHPGRLFVVLTSNEVRDLSDPLLRRCLRHRMGFHPPEVEAEILREGTGLPQGVAREIVRMMNIIRTYTRSQPSLYEGVRLGDILRAVREGELRPSSPMEFLATQARMHLCRRPDDWDAVRDRLRPILSSLWGELIRSGG